MSLTEAFSMPKPVADGLWCIDGPEAPCCGHLLPQAMHMVRLGDGGLWLLNPLPPSPSLIEAVRGLGELRSLAAGNARHVAHLAGWAEAFPHAAQKPVPEIETIELRGLDPGETAFYHAATGTLFLTDFIIALDTAALPVWRRPAIWLKGLDDSAPRLPRALRRGLRDPDALADDIERLIVLRPRRLVLAHGRVFERGVIDLIERAFRKLLQNRRWERAFEAQRAGRG